MTEAQLDGIVVDLVVDIGRDGGKLSVTFSPRRYWINGVRVDEREAWVWIWRWHWIRDRLKLEACPCEPCVWYRAEEGRLCPATNGSA